MTELPPRTYLPVEQEWIQPYVADGGIPCQHIMTFTPDPNGFVALQVQFLEAILEDAGYRRRTEEPHDTGWRQIGTTPDGTPVYAKPRQ